MKISIILQIGLGVILLILTLTKSPKNRTCNTISRSMSNILLIILFLTYSFLLFYRINEVPVPYNVDEAGLAYDANSIVQYHTDRYGIHLPVYFNNFGGGQSALYLYITAFLIKLFGYSVFNVRLPAIIFSLISTAMFIYTVRKEMGDSASVFALLLFNTLPFSIMHSRWGLDAYLLFPMLIISTTVFYHTMQTSSMKWYILSGILFGITLYSYAISYAILPVFLTLTLIYLYSIRKLNLKHFIGFCVPFLLFALPLMLKVAIDKGIINEIRTRFFSITKLIDNRYSDISITNVINNLKLNEHNIFFNLFINDFTGYDIIPKFGSLYYICLPILVYGFMLSAKDGLKTVCKKDFSWNLFILLLFISSFPISLLLGNQNMHRSCALFIPLIFFLIVGFTELYRKKRWCSNIFVFVLFINFYFFISFYFTDFQNELKFHILYGSITDLYEALEFADSVDINDDTIYVLDPHQVHILVMLEKEISPEIFIENKVLSSYDGYVKSIGKYRFLLDAVMPECIYIFKDTSKIPDPAESYGMQSKQFGSYSVYYPTQ